MRSSLHVAIEDYPDREILRKFLETVNCSCGSKTKIACTHRGNFVATAKEAASRGHKVEFVAVVSVRRAVFGLRREAHFDFAINEYLGGTPRLPWKLARRIHEIGKGVCFMIAIAFRLVPGATL